MRAIISSMLLLSACGGSGVEEASSPSQTPVGGGEAPEAPPPRALALARYGCEELGWTLTYTIDEHERDCDDASTSAPLTIVQRPGPSTDGPQRFAFTLGANTGEGDVCRAPSPCEDQDHTFAVLDGDPPRVEWSLSLADESVEHGSATVLLCNDAPPPPCEL